MQSSSYFKVSGLNGSTFEARAWLASQLRWERTLDRLRSKRHETDDEVTDQAA